MATQFINRFFLLLALVTASSDVFAVAQLEPKTQAVAVASEARASEEVAVLKGQLEVHKDYTQHLLSTVYWSLGGVLSITMLIAGFGWFANFKIYEKDREILARELQAKFEEAIAELKSGHDERVSAAIDEIPKLIENSIGNKFDGVNHLLKSVRASSRKSIADLKCDIALLERKNWIREGVLANALSFDIEHLEAAITAESEFHIRKALENMRDALSTLVTKQKKKPLDTLEIQELEGQLAKVGSHNGTLVFAIKKLVAEGTAL